jgi:demethylmenaquinone methyltransferase/2-methoxy-6-polyprenyl-1,4-benzoquinol methylase
VSIPAGFEDAPVNGARRATAPHRVLTRYYATESERRRFVTTLFDGGARYYDRVCGVMSFGSGRSYRRDVLVRAGLARGMRLLDVATGTGLVARSAVELLGDPRAVVGLDPSAGMLREARKALASPLVGGHAEELPFADARFDVVSIGYALRHVADLGMVFRECLRVLKPGGRLVVLEITRPRSALSRGLVRLYFQALLPLLMRVSTGNGQAGLLTRYYWDTIAECVPPDTIMAVMRESGFVGVSRHVLGGILSEYVAARPAA